MNLIDLIPMIIFGSTILISAGYLVLEFVRARKL